MSKGGGYITSPSQGIQEDVPFENLCALIDTAKEYAQDLGLYNNVTTWACALRDCTTIGTNMSEIKPLARATTILGASCGGVLLKFYCVNL